MNFSDKVVVVTGASRGIGRVVAQQFAEQGARLIVHYRSHKKAAKETLASLKGGPHIIVQADMAHPKDVRHLVHTAVQKMGSIDILVNNAGIYETYSIAEIDYEKWQRIWHRTLATNLLGPANLSLLVAQHMIKQGGGKIINISSRGAFRGEPESPAYGASKAGLNAMSQSFAKALAPHKIFVYVVAPGFVETDMTVSMLAGPEGDAIRSQSPLGRAARPEEVASTILFLASENTEYLTGCIVDINGASYLRS